MADKPILFSAPMVRAILEGRKTMTRRVLKPQPPINATSAGFFSAHPGIGVWLSGDPRDCDTWENLGEFTTKYAIGDRLWVREAWRVETGDRNHVAPRDLPSDTKILFDADADWNASTRVGKRRPGMFMPRWASRITLEVIAVKVERLQDISEDDARAEGIEIDAWDMCVGSRNYMKPDQWFYTWPDAFHYDGLTDVSHLFRRSFQSLWESINGPGSWEANPWVAAYSFRVPTPQPITGGGE